jgi:hypothetical protein
MPALEQFEISSDKLQQLLAALTALNRQDGPSAITPEWMQQAQEVLSRSGTFMADASFAGPKSSPHFHRYRSELVRLKETIEQGWCRLISRRSAIRAEQLRLRQVRALTSTLGSME